jgi:hypothetical protein
LECAAKKKEAFTTTPDERAVLTESASGPSAAGRVFYGFWVLVAR